MGLSMLSSIRHQRNKSKRRGYASLIISKPPWAVYGALYSNNSLQDETGNGRHATTMNVVYATSAIGNGNGVPLNVAKSVDKKPSITNPDPNAALITFPSNSIPINHTICFIDRYTGTTTSTNRFILYDKLGSSYYLGHNANTVGTVYYQNYITTSVSQTPNAVNKWVVMCVTSGGNVPDNILVNGLSKGTSLLPTLITPGQLAINSDTYFPTPIPNSSFELAKLIIFDQVLTYNEMIIVSDALTTYLATGVLE
jgi:hypothetical protein